MKSGFIVVAGRVSAGLQDLQRKQPLIIQFVTFFITDSVAEGDGHRQTMGQGEMKIDLTPILV